MKHRQSSIPERWLVADCRLGSDLWPALERLPPRSGVLFLYRDMPQPERRRLLAEVRAVARRRELLIADEAEGEARRVHDSAEILAARLAAVPVLFLSPLFTTRSHPERKPLGRMRAARLVRMANAPVVALGGMNEWRFERIRALGFCGWAGIDAWSAP